MIIKNFVSGPLNTNSYLVYNKEAVIIDAGGDMSELINYLKQRGITPKIIIATHGHFDHVMGIPQLKKVYPSLTFVANKKDIDLIKNSKEMALRLGIKIDEISLPDEYIKEGDVIKLDNDEELRIIETPGHTMGSVCILTKNSIFTGDTLFSGTVGRTDLGGSSKLLKISLEKIKRSLPDDLVVYPGHGNFTTLGYEKIKNPFMNGEIDLEEIGP
ncbi:MBL fold metallo-hydrolase [Acidianus sulfidivorans JP7]|uniref:MBL fold metallo-hydrolase n=1 Tax=Acidianus sulfidivorans JP7 TaxID=619593 RepID=A0A2U9ILQ8_9CREN|nr:MBL fold metallo-hydrolase [Acidianus sulfidivorans]AWR96940.1 MBL fold metallo-hydrolase [Acidianus sulfidivorans JP7]